MSLLLAHQYIEGASAAGSWIGSSRHKVGRQGSLELKFGTDKVYSHRHHGPETSKTEPVFLNLIPSVLRTHRQKVFAISHLMIVSF